MKEQKIINDKETCCAKQFNPKLTPEQEIKYLKRELRDAEFKVDYKRDELCDKEIQVQALVDVMCEVRECNKNQANEIRWQGRRMAEYREAFSDVNSECRNVILDYEHMEKGEAGRPSKAMYEFAKKILGIVERF